MVVWPGITVAVVGLAVGCLASAFYYHHGAWGALQTAGQPLQKLRGHVEALRLDPEYITCLVRFGRVFFGLGLMVLAAGLIKWRILPAAIGTGAVLLGWRPVSTMALERMIYAPVFHLNSLWLLATGLVILRSGLRLEPQAEIVGLRNRKNGSFRGHPSELQFISRRGIPWSRSTIFISTGHKGGRMIGCILLLQLGLLAFAGPSCSGTARR